MSDIIFKVNFTKVLKELDETVPVVESESIIQEVEDEKLCKVDLKNAGNIDDSPFRSGIEILETIPEEEDQLLSEAFGKEIHVDLGNAENIDFITTDVESEVLKPVPENKAQFLQEAFGEKVQAGSENTGNPRKVRFVVGCEKLESISWDEHLSVLMAAEKDWDKPQHIDQVDLKAKPDVDKKMDGVAELKLHTNQAQVSNVVSDKKAGESNKSLLMKSVENIFNKVFNKKNSGNAIPVVKSDLTWEGMHTGGHFDEIDVASDNTNSIATDAESEGSESLPENKNQSRQEAIAKMIQEIPNFDEANFGVQPNSDDNMNGPYDLTLQDDQSQISSRAVDSKANGSNRSFLKKSFGNTFNKFFNKKEKITGDKKNKTVWYVEQPTDEIKDD